MALYPTKTRLALLAAVDSGHVLDWPDDDERMVTWDTTGAEQGEAARKVTARIDEMHRAGWVRPAPDGMTWSLTDAGQAMLDDPVEASRPTPLSARTARDRHMVRARVMP